jgi:hypothetical protein
MSSTINDNENVLENVDIKTLCKKLKSLSIKDVICQWALYTDKYEQITSAVSSVVILAYETMEVYDLRSKDILNYLSNGLPHNDKIILQVASNLKNKKLDQTADAEKIKQIRLKAKQIEKKLERWRLKLRKACYGEDIQFGKINI